MNKFQEFHVDDLISRYDGGRHVSLDKPGAQYKIIWCADWVNDEEMRISREGYYAILIQAHSGGNSKDYYVGYSIPTHVLNSLSEDQKYYEISAEHLFIWKVVSAATTAPTVKAKQEQIDSEYEKAKRFFFSDLEKEYRAPEGSGLKYL